MWLKSNTFKGVEPSEETSNSVFTETTTFEVATTDAAPEDYIKIAEESKYRLDRWIKSRL